jgi:hypothetical protein
MDMRHGGPYDRGAADRYYERPYSPHYFVGETYSSKKINESEMTQKEIDEYRRGWDNEVDRKEW